MLKDVLIELRKYSNYTQEDIANKLNVSRQAVSKWESGQSVPDIYNCQELCRLYGISIDELLESDKRDLKSIGPAGKYIFGYVKVAEDGSVVLPKECLKTMNVTPGSVLLCLGDIKQGIALVCPDGLEKFANEVLSAKEDYNNGNR